MRRLASFGAALALTAVVPAAAHAATLTNSGGTLTYTAAAGTQTGIEFSQAAAPSTIVTVTRHDEFGDTDPITLAGSGCTLTTAGAPFVYDCTGVARVAADAGDSFDQMSADTMRVPTALAGGSGNDSLSGGPGADSLSGGPGDDSLFPGSGANTVSGGTGFDSVNDFVNAEPPATAAPAVSITLDDVANDGTAGQGANVLSDVEDVSADSSFTPDGGTTFTFGSLTLTGNAGQNIVSGSTGNDTITGGAGNDQLFGNGGNDTMNARDGFADRVSCGDGVDTAIVDTLDTVSDDCENISVADVGNANEDKPPTLTWAFPASNAKLVGSKAGMLTVAATDDKAVAKVVFMDDDQVICTVTAAPYTCAYAPKGTDIGRNTLTATAFDAAGQTASSVRDVTVTRFSAKSLSLKTSTAKDKTAPYSFTAKGALTRSATVSKTLNCTGTVKISVKAGSKTLWSKSVKLSKSCTYSAKASFSSRKGFASNGKLKVKAVFGGNATISSKSSSTKTVSTK
jgi:hypothetical protein